MAYSYKNKAVKTAEAQQTQLATVQNQTRSEVIQDGKYCLIVGDSGSSSIKIANPWTVPSFYNSVRDTASALARTTCLVKKEDTNEPDKKHDAYWLLNWKANPFMTSVEFIRCMLVSAIAYADGYAWIKREDGINPSSLHVLDPRYTDCVYLYDGPELVDVQYIHVKDGNEIFIPYDDVIHIRNLCIGGEDSIDVEAMYQGTIQKANSIQTFQNLYFENGSNFAKVLKIPGWLTDEQKAKIKADMWHLNGGLKNSHTLSILQGGTELETVSLNAQDMELATSADQILTDVANATSTPGTRIGARGAISYGSLAQDNLLFIQNLDNWYTPFENELSVKLLKFRQQGMTHYIEFDRDSLLVADPEWQKLQMEKFLNKIITLDEVRLKLGESLIPLGEFEKAPAAVVAPVQAEEQPVEDQSTVEPQDQTDTEDQTRGIALTENILGRVKKRILKAVEAGKTDLTNHHKIIRNELRGLNCEPVMEQLNSLQTELDSVLPEQRKGIIKQWNFKQTAAKIWN